MLVYFLPTPSLFIQITHGRLELYSDLAAKTGNSVIEVDDRLINYSLGLFIFT